MRDSVDFLRGLDALTSGKTLKQILTEARATISDPDSWCQHRIAKDASGHLINPSSPLARQWCLSGAIARASNNYGISPPGILQYLDSFLISGEVKNKLEFKKAEEFNDFYQHRYVLAYLDYVIERTP